MLVGWPAQLLPVVGAVRLDEGDGARQGEALAHACRKVAHPIARAVGLEVQEYPYYERGQATIRFEDMIAALSAAAPGDIALLHGCCHNPTGADLSPQQWLEVTELVAERGLIPVVDIAYQGFGDGLAPDAAGLRGILDACDTVLVGQSCDKNFGVYRDRVGSVWFKTPSAASTATAMSHVLQISREFWSMPPDHGAAAVRIVLDELAAEWRVELEGMRERIATLTAMAEDGARDLESLARLVP